MASLIFTLAKLAVDLFSICIFIYIVSSWVPALRSSSFGQLIGRIVEPYLSIFRKFIPPVGMIDFSPIVAIFVFNFLSKIVLSGLATVLAIF
jgi:YggT family protein